MGPCVQRRVVSKTVLTASLVSAFCVGALSAHAQRTQRVEGLRERREAGESQLQLQGKAIEGGLMIGHAAPGSRVTLDGRRIRVSEDGYFLIGFGKEAPEQATLTVVSPDRHRERRVLRIEQREYGTDRINDLPSEMVELDDAMRQKLRTDNRTIDQVRAHFTPETYFRGGFEWPARGRIAASFGTERVLNGEPRNDHEGVDIAVPLGTPVRAPAEGVVAFVSPDVALAGQVIILDHGMGLTTSFLHLSQISVTNGQHVNKGDVLGLAGESGRTTGPHLHWGANLFQVALDPALLVGTRPSRPVGSERRDVPAARSSAAQSAGQSSGRQQRPH